MASKLSRALSLVLAAAVGVGAASLIARYGNSSGVAVQSTTSVATATPVWSATASGRVEPRDGEIRVGAQAPGRITEVVVRLNDRVIAGDLLVRLEDDEARAKVSAADAEAAVRRRERDAEAAAGRLAQDRRQAEDNVALAERAVGVARIELDRLQQQRRSNTAGTTDDTVTTARTAVDTGVAKLEQERAALRTASNAAGLPLPTRVEAGLTAARADLSQAETALERTKIRSPISGSVLHNLARLGETAGVTPEQPLLVLGDLTALRVRAEVEDRDVAKVRTGQAAIIRSDAFPGRDFTGTVSTVAPSLGSPKIAPRGPKKPTDIDTLEVLIDAQGDGLIPGMRVDVFFRVDGATPKSAAPEAAMPAVVPPMTTVTPVKTEAKSLPPALAK